MADETVSLDLLIIGGGVNGAAIARDAAGRGLRVLLCEQDDLASHTSSASTKLIHGGLRYLEYYEFKLVREALEERARLLHTAPHIISPLRFVLPHDSHLRPAWMIRAGMFLYDHLGGRGALPGSRAIDLRKHAAGKPLDARFRKGFVYSDCRVDDARLVVLDAIDAREHGATIETHVRCVKAERKRDGWHARLVNVDDGSERTVVARCLVNAAGPWVAKLFGDVIDAPAPAGLRLVKGSHIVVPRMYAHEDAYIFQNEDRRIVFTIPYQDKYTLIGTTDVDFKADPAHVVISDEEIEYLCRSVNRYFHKGIRPEDVVWSYAGVRPLFADEHQSAASVTREYVLELDPSDGFPLLSVFGGKLTTSRSLAEHAMAKLQPLLGFEHVPWTDTAPLPGGDMPNADFDAFFVTLRRDYPWLPQALALRYARSYGTRTPEVIAGARSMDELGRCLGADLFENEVRYLTEKEWARSADDILWRRSKLGLRVTPEQAAALAQWLERCTTPPVEEVSR